MNLQPSAVTTFDLVADMLPRYGEEIWSLDIMALSSTRLWQNHQNHYSISRGPGPNPDGFRVADFQMASAVFAGPAQRYFTTLQR